MSGAPAATVSPSLNLTAMTTAVTWGFRLATSEAAVWPTSWSTRGTSLLMAVTTCTGTGARPWAWGASAASAAAPRSAATGEYKPVAWGTPVKLRLYPEELDKSYKRPDATLPRPFSHWMDWVDAAKARKQAGAPFEYGGALAQIADMGNIACFNKGKILYYDAKKGQFKNNDEANKLFGRPSFREGWTLPS